MSWLSAVLGGAVVLAAGCIVRRNAKSIHAFILAKMIRPGNKKLRPYKEKLFAPLSALSEQKGPHACKVLELGGGGGANFEFVTSPVEWTVTEPNVKFAPYFQKTVTELGGRHRINDLVEASGEDLGLFAPDSFDAVVVSLVLCTVSDVGKVLSEVRRVLKPGGKFYFIEHVGGKKGTKLRWFQDALTNIGLWPWVGDGCCLNRDTEDALRKAQFSKVEVVNYRSSSWLMLLLTSQMYGWATK